MSLVLVSRPHLAPGWPEVHPTGTTQTSLPSHNTLIEKYMKGQTPKHQAAQ